MCLTENIAAFSSLPLDIILALTKCLRMFKNIFSIYEFGVVILEDSSIRNLTGHIHV